MRTQRRSRLRCPGGASGSARGRGVGAPSCPPLPVRGGGCPQRGRGRSSARAGSRSGVTPSVRCGRLAALPSPARLRGSRREACPRAPEGGGRAASLPAHRARLATCGPERGGAALWRPAAGWRYGRRGAGRPGGLCKCPWGAVGSPGLQVRVVTGGVAALGRLTAASDLSGSKFLWR